MDSDSLYGPIRGKEAPEAMKQEVPAADPAEKKLRRLLVTLTLLAGIFLAGTVWFLFDRYLTPSSQKSKIVQGS